MAKTKSYEDLRKELDAAKEKRSAAREALKEFCKTNKIKEGVEASSIEKKDLRIKYKELRKAADEAKASVEALSAETKAAKPAKVRETKYDYPADCVTADQKKKFRSAQRAAEKRKAKEAAGGGKKEKPAKSEKTEKSAKAEKSDKKKKKTSDD